MTRTFWIAHVLAGLADGWVLALIGNDVAIRWTGASPSRAVVCFAVPFLFGPWLLARRLRFGDPTSFLVMSLLLRGAGTLLASIAWGGPAIGTVAATIGTLSALGAAAEHALPGVRGGHRARALARYTAAGAGFTIASAGLKPSASDAGFYLSCALFLVAAQVAAGMGRWSLAIHARRRRG